MLFVLDTGHWFARSILAPKACMAYPFVQGQSGPIIEGFFRYTVATTILTESTPPSWFFRLVPSRARPNRHKVLQILVNLITNAKHALEESRCPDPQVTFRIGINGNTRVKVTVSDNGIGIAAENFSRVFSYGFTTRKNGHGFGLHSGVIFQPTATGT